MSKETVRWERSGRLIELILDGPDRGNALDLATARQLQRAGEQIATEPDVGAVLIRAVGKNFCVGGDLKEFAAVGDHLGPHIRQVAEGAHVATEALAALGVPLVTAAQGAIAGAGVGLALLGDVVFFGRSTKLRLAYPGCAVTPSGCLEYR